MLAIFLPTIGGKAQGGTSACSRERPQDAVVDAVSADATLHLADGRAVKLADIAIPEAGRPEALRRLTGLIGTPVRLNPIANDRYGRFLAQVAVKGAAPSLQESLVREGFAFVVPEVMDAACVPALLAAERTARRDRAGIWDGALRIRQADDPKLAAAVGTYALVEGRVLSVGTTQTNHYLNFGHDWSVDFTVMVPVSDLGSWEHESRDLDRLKGRRIRVRGLLESWNGVLVRVWNPAQIEPLEGEEDR
ncbi:thermonuclease family protein [Amorphus sp. 3PC139-8]|uniref:thermonuclease family protein n=1 Tax=Amorphus sp. 3PC139-8 TaxID=2735676 RepID=UPI00345D1CB8